MIWCLLLKTKLDLWILMMFIDSWILLIDDVRIQPALSDKKLAWFAGNTAAMSIKCHKDERNEITKMSAEDKHH